MTAHLFRFDAATEAKLRQLAELHHTSQASIVRRAVSELAEREFERRNVVPHVEKARTGA